MSKIIRERSVEQKHFSWKVENFAHIRKSVEALESQRFNFEMGGQFGLPMEFCIYLTQEGHETCGQVWTELMLQLLNKSDNIKDVYLGLQVKIENFNLVECEVCNLNGNSGPFKLSDFEDWIYHDIVSEDVWRRHPPLTSDGAVVFEICVELYIPKINRPVDVSLLLAKFTADKFIPKQQSELSSKLQEKDCCPQSNVPMKFVCNDGVEMQINRGMIAARSPVFRRMFQLDMLEAKTGVVQIQDISSPAMKVILHFMYAGILLEEWSNAGIVEELVYAAVKYELVDLMEFLDQGIGLICTEENVVKLMKLARKQNLKNAQKGLLRFKGIHTSLEDIEKFMEDLKEPGVVMSLNSEEFSSSSFEDTTLTQSVSARERKRGQLKTRSGQSKLGAKKFPLDPFGRQ